MGKADNDAFEVTSPEGVVVIEHIYGTVGLETLQSLILYKKMSKGITFRHFLVIRTYLGQNKSIIVLYWAKFICLCSWKCEILGYR